MTDTTILAGMARPNDTVAPPRANQDETNDDDNHRENRRSSIMIDGEDGEGQHMVTLEEFLQFVSEKPEWFYEKLQQVYQRYEECLEDREAQLAEEELHSQTKEGQLVILRREMDEVKEQLQNQNNRGDRALHQELSEAISERDAFATQIARLVMNSATNGGRQSSMAPTVQKSTKIPDPPMLNDGREPRFEDWLLLMSQKLAANADHFNTPQLRMAYVASRCDGRARKHITPRMRDDVVNPYTDSKDILDHLKMIYNDPNRITTAKHQFRQLYMKPGDKFHDFLSEFLYLAAEAGVAENNWRDELYTKLTTKLQELCISASYQDGPFRDFSDAVSQTASQLEVIHHRNQKSRVFTSNKDTNKGTNRPGTTIKKELTPSQSSSPTTLQSSGVGRDQLMKEGRCFHCQEHGHLARDCPTKSSITELKGLERKVSESELNDNAGKV